MTSKQARVVTEKIYRLLGEGRDLTESKKWEEAYAKLQQARMLRNVLDEILSYTPVRSNKHVRSAVMSAYEMISAYDTWRHEKAYGTKKGE